jgi:molybdenum cofactor biosynthesis enzyme MoaA
MAPCNAVCLGCISESHYEGNSPQQRLAFQPTIQEIIEVGVEHLTHAKEGIISFGQGCEGEPSLNSEKIAPAITAIRNICKMGTININTNAGYTKGIQRLCKAGLDALRVTIFSCQPENYTIYHQPRDYQLVDVENSINEAKSRGLRVSLNLLTFPGFTDREEEAENLIEFVARNKIDVIQLRNLNMDPEKLFSRIPPGGKSIGIVDFIDLIHKEVPSVTIGSYTHPIR